MSDFRRYDVTIGEPGLGYRFTILAKISGNNQDEIRNILQKAVDNYPGYLDSNIKRTVMEYREREIISPEGTIIRIEQI